MGSTLSPQYNSYQWSQSSNDRAARWVKYKSWFRKGGGLFKILFEEVGFTGAVLASGGS
jgi:hypothetical protein